MAHEANEKVGLAVWCFVKVFPPAGESINLRFQSDEFGITFVYGFPFRRPKEHDYTPEPSIEPFFAFIVAKWMSRNGQLVLSPHAAVDGLAEQIGQGNL